MSKIKKKFGLKKNQKNLKKRKIVCLGGGTGASIVLSGLKKYSADLSAVVTMFDSGGSSGKLRKELDILPLGDVRQCLIALSDEKKLIPLFCHRFTKGSLKGHNFGNLFLASLTELTGSLNKALEKMNEILRIKGRVIPVTLEKADLVAVLKNNKKIKEEEKIINCPQVSEKGVKKLFLKPEVKANKEAISVIKKADLIIIAPGKFYTSILPVFLVKGISEAIRNSFAKKIFVCNLMTQTGNTDEFCVEDFLKILEKHLGESVIDFIVFNTGKLPKNLMKRIRKVFPKTDFIKYEKKLFNQKKFIGTDLIDRQVKNLDPADNLVKGANKRTMILHDSDKLAKIILKICKL